MSWHPDLEELARDERRKGMEAILSKLGFEHVEGDRWCKESHPGGSTMSVTIWLDVIEKEIP